MNGSNARLKFDLREEGEVGGHYTMTAWSAYGTYEVNIYSKQPEAAANRVEGGGWAVRRPPGQRLLAFFHHNELASVKPSQGRIPDLEMTCQSSQVRSHGLPRPDHQVR